MVVVDAEADGPALARHGGQADDRAFGRLSVDLGQHHVGCIAGEGTFALDRWQLTRIAQHQDGLAEGEQITRHLIPHHGHFVENEELCVPQSRLLVEDEARLVTVGEPELQRREL